MNNEERDNMLIEIHGDMKVMVEKVSEHHTTLYGNAKPGIVNDITLLRERQDQCPARKAITNEAKRLKLSHIMMVLAILSFLSSIIIHFFSS